MKIKIVLKWIEICIDNIGRDKNYINVDFYSYWLNVV